MRLQRGQSDIKNSEVWYSKGQSGITNNREVRYSKGRLYDGSSSPFVCGGGGRGVGGGGGGRGGGRECKGHEDGLLSESSTATTAALHG